MLLVGPWVHFPLIIRANWAIEIVKSITVSPNSPHVSLITAVVCRAASLLSFVRIHANLPITVLSAMALAFGLVPDVHSLLITSISLISSSTVFSRSPDGELFMFF